MEKIIEEKLKDNLTIFKSLEYGKEYDEVKNILKYQLLMNIDKVDFKKNFEKNIIPTSYNIIDRLYRIYIFNDSTYMYNPRKFLEPTSNDGISEFDEWIMNASIKNHCIISIFYTAKYLYLKDKTVSIAQLGELRSDCGYWTFKEVFESMKKYTANLLCNAKSAKDEIKILQRIWKPLKYKERSNFLNKFKKFCADPNYMYIKNSLSSNSVSNIPLYDSDYTYSMMNCSRTNIDTSNIDTYSSKAINPFKLNMYLKKLRENKNTTNCKVFNNKFYDYMSNILCEYNKNKIFIHWDGNPNVYDEYRTKKNHKSSLREINVKVDEADRVLFNYKYEKMLNYNLISCIMKNLKLTIEESSSKTSILENSLIEILPKYSLLSNVFSRSYFINSFFKNSNKNPFNITKNNPRKLITFANKEYDNEIIKAVGHINSLYDFILNLSNVTIPIYERYFFIIIYEYFEYKCNKENKGNPLEEMLNELHNYVAKNAEYLMFDFDFDNNENTYSLIEEYNANNKSLNKDLLYGEAFFRSKANKDYVEKSVSKKNKIDFYNNDINKEKKMINCYAQLILELFQDGNNSNLKISKFDIEKFTKNSKENLAKIYSETAINNIK